MGESHTAPGGKQGGEDAKTSGEGMEEAAAEKAQAAGGAEERGREAVDAPMPKNPNPLEWERHALTHIHYAPWCSVCVKGRGRDDPHRAGRPHADRISCNSISPSLKARGKRTSWRRSWSASCARPATRTRWQKRRASSETKCSGTPKCGSRMQDFINYYCALMASQASSRSCARLPSRERGPHGKLKTLVNDDMEEQMTKLELVE